MRYGEAGQSHLLPFLGAAALFAALTIMAHSVVLGLAAVIGCGFCEHYCADGNSLF